MWRNRLTTRNRVIGELTTGALFFGMRSCEYLTVDGPRKTKILRLRNLRFFHQRQEITKTHKSQSIFTATSISITFEFQKNNQKDETVIMHANGKELCPVQAWAKITHRILQYPGATIDLPVNTMLIKSQLTLLTSKEVISHIRATVEVLGMERMGFGPKEVGIHSIRSSFAMFLYTQFVRTDKIMLQGRWKSDAFLVYIRKQVSEFSKGLSDLMIHMNNEYFTIPEPHRENSRDIVTNQDDPRTRHLFSFTSSLNNNGPNSNGTQTIRPNFHLWS